MHDGGLSFWSAVAIVEHDHVVSSGGAVADADSEVRVPPLILHELAAQTSKQRVRLLSSDPQEACDRDVIFSPARGRLGGEAGPLRDAAVLVAHQSHVRARQTKSQILLDCSDQGWGDRGFDVLLARVVRVFPEVV